LESVLTNKLKEDIGIETNASLSDAGFFVDAVAPNDNFFITPSGIGFYFNSYELAPYAMGHTSIWLDFVSLKQMLNPDFLKKMQ
ncbi:RsiV family protein, partial [Arthrospira platensis SPKY1]|nr:RsiV family protein [Arthrospira platensis SPKY1]